MDDFHIAELAEKLRLREEQRDALKKSRHVQFDDHPNQKYEFENLCIFKAEKIKKRAEDWPTEQMEKPDLYAKIFDGIKNHYLNDINIRFGKIRFKCPKILLTCFSKIFSHPDEHMTIDLHTFLIRPICFSSVYKWMLTEAIQGRPGLREINEKNVLEILDAAKKLKISHLEDQCWYFLQKTARCNEKLAFQLYKSSEFNLQEIQQLLLSRICKYFLSLVASDDFVQLECTEVCILLSLNSLGVNSEIEVFYAGVLWLNFMWHERSEDNLKDIMSCVRFNLMPSWFLVALNERTNCEAVDRITAHDFVANLITDAIIYTANQISYYATAEKLTGKVRMQKKMSLPMQRRWIYDKSCPYHFKQNSELMDYVTFEMFTKYLTKLRSFGDDYWRTLDFVSGEHCIKVWRSRPNTKPREQKKWAVRFED